MRQSIRDEVMQLTSRLEQKCHTRVAEQYAGLLARFARLDTACNAFNAILGCRPADDADVFEMLSMRRRQIADVLAHANLDAYEQQLRVNSAMTRFPRVWIMFIAECFLSVSMAPERM